MSKTTLRKAIKDFEAPELRELLFDVYVKSKEARELLDFFAEPDIKKKTEEYRTQLTKEAARYTRHAYHPRMTKIRSILKRFRSLEPGPEAIAELMVHSILVLMEIGRTNWLSDSTYGGIEKLFGETIDHLNQYGLMEMYLPRIRKAGATISRIGIYKNPFSGIFERQMKRIESL
ncbi:MAG: perilipin family protein [Bacteroides sp.]|nr:perilipin family protein [Bacteroides sp.]